MLRSRRLILGTFAIASLALLAFACDGDDEAAVPTPTATQVASAAPGPATFEVTAGAAEGAFDIEQFMPATVRVRTGDTVHWRGSGHEGHTITFIPPEMTLSDVVPGGYLLPAPDQPEALEFNQNVTLSSAAQGTYDGAAYTNSGIFGVPAEGEYSLSFPEEGVYPYLCMIHPFHMRGVVVVDAADAAVSAPEAVVAQGDRDRERYVEEARVAAETMERERLAASDVTANGRSWEVGVGVDTPHAQVLTFMPASLDIDTGDTVVFWNSERDFHNVVFTPEGQDPPPFPIIKPVEGRDGFRLLINPDAQRETPPPAGFGPDDFFSSGMMGITLPRLYYEVTFTQPGTYRYACTIHALAGMAGVVDVNPPEGR
ncbi:MAG: plastocyanin/azurin family copper-binding protein [Dehalococcoidia bacterium]